MIINFFGIQLEIIDNGDGTYDIRPIDAVADRQAIRDEIARVKEIKAAAVADIGESNDLRDRFTAGRDSAVADRTTAVAKRDAAVLRIDELRAFLLAAGDPDPGT